MLPVHSPGFAVLRKMPFTISVALANVAVFIVCLIVAGTDEGPRWTATLLRMGAQFSPLTLDREYHRIVTHPFLHGSLGHLILNLYFLAYAGIAIEQRVGTRKFAFVFFLSVIAAALSSMYWNLFTVGIGAAGAISGLFGFFLVYNIFLSERKGRPVIVLLTHLTSFAAMSIVFHAQVHADYAALYGGFIMGVMTGLVSFARANRAEISRIHVEYAMIAFLLAMFFMMPGYQVRYFKFFQQMVAAEDTTRFLLREKLTDDDMHAFIRNYHHWEDVETRLVNQRNLPTELSLDTIRLRRYIRLRKQENMLKKLVVQREAYIYLDSIERLHEIMRRYMTLDYALWSRIRPVSSTDSLLASQMSTYYYDSLGHEIAGPTAAYFRMGVRDSLGRWNGAFREYDDQARLRIKGTYRRNKRDGVFLYYSEGGKCIEAGRFVDDKKFGKWQHFHSNGRLAAEVFHNKGRFVGAVWDSFGNPLVVDGNGKQIQLHSNGVIALSGEFRHGQEEGVWYGWYDTGDMHFEETFNQGRLVAGKSRSPDGETFLYDESSLYPLPEGGVASFEEYLKAEVKAFDCDEMGHVKLSFRVTPASAIVDLMVDQGASEGLDTKACEIILKGPRWLPAREHGYIYLDVRAQVQVEFY